MTIEYGDTRLPNRFWNKVKVPEVENRNDVCWTWTGAIKTRGHGYCAVFSAQGKVTTVLVAIGDAILNVNREVEKATRTCSNSSCSNPNHVQKVEKGVCKRGHKGAKKYSNGQCSECRREFDRRKDKSVVAERARNYRARRKSDNNTITRAKPQTRAKPIYNIPQAPPRAPVKPWRPAGWPEDILNGKLKAK